MTAPPDAQLADPPRVGRWRDTALVVAACLGAYLLLLNPFWTPGGDSELFLAAARDILDGQGYAYNGKPVAIAPPLWPYVVAGVLWLSPTFLAVKIVTLTLMAAGFGLAHRVMLRLCPPAWAAWSCVIAALFVPAYSLTFWLHSEPLFLCLAWGAALCATRLAEASGRAGSLLGLILLCAAMAGARWTSGLQWGIVAAVLLGRWRPTWRRPMPAGGVSLGLGLSAVATVVVFLLLFFGLPAMALALDAPATDPGQAGLPVTQQDPENATPDVFDNDIFRDASWWGERGWRVLNAGQWPAWALWYPTRFAGGLPVVSLVPLAVGWLVLLLLATAAWGALTGRGAAAAFPAGRFAWGAVVGYLALLAFLWPLPNARYLVPIGPLLVAGVLWGCRDVGRWLSRPRLGAGLGGLFLWSLVLVNGAMFAVDLAVQRSGDRLLGGSPQRYYETYEAGLHVSLLRAVDVLRDRGLADGELAVSERYFNLGRMRFSKGGPRNAVMLLDRVTLSPSEHYSFPPGQIPRKLFKKGIVDPGGFRAWAASHGVKYYLYQEPSEPWRLWHFRVPDAVRRALAGEPEEPGPSFGWRLYTAEDGFEKPVDLDGRDFEAPTRLPGL